MQETPHKPGPSHGFTTIAVSGKGYGDEAARMDFAVYDAEKQTRPYPQTAEKVCYFQLNVQEYRAGWYSRAVGDTSVIWVGII